MSASARPAPSSPGTMPFTTRARIMARVSTTPPPARPPFPGTEQIDPAEVFSGPGYQAPRTRTDPAAVAALILGLLFFIPGAGAIAAILGLWALRRLRGSYDAGLTQAWFGVVVGGAATAAWLWIWCLITLPG